MVTSVEASRICSFMLKLWFTRTDDTQLVVKVRVLTEYYHNKDMQTKELHWPFVTVHRSGNGYDDDCCFQGYVNYDPEHDIKRATDGEWLVQKLEGKKVMAEKRDRL